MNRAFISALFVTILLVFGNGCQKYDPESQRLDNMLSRVNDLDQLTEYLHSAPHDSKLWHALARRTQIVLNQSCTAATHSWQTDRIIYGRFRYFEKEAISLKHCFDKEKQLKQWELEQKILLEIR